MAYEVRRSKRKKKKGLIGGVGGRTVRRNLNCDGGFFKKVRVVFRDLGKTMKGKKSYFRV